MLRQLMMLKAILDLAIEFPEIDKRLIEMTKDILSANVDYRISEAEWELSREYNVDGTKNEGRKKLKAIQCYRHRNNSSLAQAKSMFDTADRNGLDYANSHQSDIFADTSTYMNKSIP